MPHDTLQCPDVSLQHPSRRRIGSHIECEEVTLTKRRSGFAPSILWNNSSNMVPIPLGRQQENEALRLPNFCQLVHQWPEIEIGFHDGCVGSAAVGRWLADCLTRRMCDKTLRLGFPSTDRGWKIDGLLCIALHSGTENEGNVLLFSATSPLGRGIFRLFASTLTRMVFDVLRIRVSLSGARPRRYLDRWNA